MSSASKYSPSVPDNIDTRWSSPAENRKTISSPDPGRTPKLFISFMMKMRDCAAPSLIFIMKEINSFGVRPGPHGADGVFDERGGEVAAFHLVDPLKR